MNPPLKDECPIPPKPWCGPRDAIIPENRLCIEVEVPNNGSTPSGPSFWLVLLLPPPALVVELSMAPCGCCGPIPDAFTPSKPPAAALLLLTLSMLLLLIDIDMRLAGRVEKEE